jgi:hypothetical protein
MANYSRGFDFDPGTLGYNLEKFGHDVDRYIDRAKEEAADRGQIALKTEAPWQDHTGYARAGLWAEPYGTARDGGIRMGHTAEYGVYLEESNDGRFQVIMPVLLKTGRAFMRSLEAMFYQMDSPVPVAPLVLPDAGLRQGTSQDAKREAHKRPRIYLRDAKGRFVSAKTKVKAIAKGVSSRTRRTRRG